MLCIVCVPLPVSINVFTRLVRPGLQDGLVRSGPVEMSDWTGPQTASLVLNYFSLDQS